MPAPTPPTVDNDGANLDPRNCDCGKGAVCPLVTKEWAAWLAAEQIDLDAWVPSWDNVPSFAVVDLRDGMVIARDAEDKPFLTETEAAHYARSRNYGLFVAAQTYRVVTIRPALFAQTRPSA